MAKASYLYFKAFSCSVDLLTRQGWIVSYLVCVLLRASNPQEADPAPGDTADLNGTDSLTKQAIGAMG